MPLTDTDLARISDAVWGRQVAAVASDLTSWTVQLSIGDLIRYIHYESMSTRLGKSQPLPVALDVDVIAAAIAARMQSSPTAGAAVGLDTLKQAVLEALRENPLAPRAQ